MYLWIGAAISDQFCVQVLDCASYQNMPETMVLFALISASLFCIFCGQCFREAIVGCKLDRFLVVLCWFLVVLCWFSGWY